MNFIRDTPLGGLLRRCGLRSQLKFPEEHDDFELPAAQKILAERSPAVEATVEEAPVEKAPAEESLAQESSAQESSTQESPPQESLAEKAPAGEASTEKAADSEAPAENTSQGVATPESETSTALERPPQTALPIKIEAVTDAAFAASTETIDALPHIVDWYNDTDPANPRNWSGIKKFWVTFVIW
jgi:hypothetical protein